MTDTNDKPDPQDDEIEMEADFGTDGPRPSEAVQDVSLVLEARTSELERALEEQKDKYLRLAAEFDNFRKRAVRERENSERHGQNVVVRGLLESLDDLARFANIDPWQTEVEPMIAGAKMVEQKLLKALAGHGLEVVNPAGEVFDPNVHEAISTAPAELPEQDNLVATVYQVGYVFKGQLLRPARVVVKQWAG